MSQQDVTQPIVFLGCYLKRLTASLGLNTTPTSVDLEIVPGFGNIPYDVSYQATGFKIDDATPGKTARIQVGEFDFAGIIQSWFKNYSTNGLTYSVRLADPRVILEGVPVITAYGIVDNSVNYTNILNAFNYYGDLQSLGSNDNGTTWSTIKTFLEATGVNFYHKKFNFIFNSGFNEATGLTSFGIPPWYRIKSSNTSFNQLIQQVASDFNFDYYAYIDTSGFSSSTGVVNNIRFEYIDRNAATGAVDIANFITGATSSGTLISYKCGQELRTDYGQSIVSGPPETLWVGANSAGGSPSIFAYWGRSLDGSAIFDEGETWGDAANVVATGIGAIPTSTGNRRRFGAILLDHIVGTGAAGILSNSVYRVPFSKYTITKNYSENSYPPTIAVGISNAEATGYLAHEQVLRAALYNQDSWESMLYRYHPAIATGLGINSQIFRGAPEFNPLITSSGDLLRSIDLSKIALDTKGSRSAFTEALIQNVYEATRGAAEEYYGRQYVVKINGYSNDFDSPWLTNGNLFGGNNIPIIEYDVVDSAWSESSDGMPESVSNHEVLNQTFNGNFKDDSNKLKAFASYLSFNSQDNTNFPYKINTALMQEGDYLIEQGSKLCVPISVQQYDKYPTYAIVSVNQPIQGINDVSGNVDRGAFRDFLQEFGYTQDTMTRFKLLDNNNDDKRFGLAPIRPFVITSAPGNHGVHFPVQFKTRNFGSWSNNSIIPGPVNLSQDSDLAPNTFGSYNNLESAGQQTVAKLSSTAYIIDSAELVIAGLPQFNLGQNIGNNSNITSLSIQYGTEGLTTNYSIRTFALPPNRVTKTLIDKISQVYNETRKNNRTLVNLDGLNNKSNRNITNVKEIKEAVDLSKVGGDYIASVIQPRNI